MPIWKIVVSEPETKKSFQLEVDQDKAIGLAGKKIGDELSGDIIGLAGYSLKVTGGTDKDGFPMHPSVRGPGRKRVLLTSPPGFHPRIKGERRRKTVRGNTISEDIAQINAKVIKKGEKSLEELIPTKKKKEEKPKVEEKPKAEEKKEKKKEEIKPEAKKEEKPQEQKFEKKEVKEKTEGKKEGGKSKA